MERCDPRRLAERVEREAGVEALAAEPGLPEPGEEWWPFPLDAWPLANLAAYTGSYRPRPVAVARPRDPGGVARLVRWARGSGACLLPRGGGSGVLGAAWPRGCCVVLDLSRLDWIRVDPGRHLVEAGAGARVEAVEGEARRLGFTLALEPQSMRYATVGGMLQTLGSGAVTPGYGNIEDVLVYVDAVLGTGEEVRLGSPGAPRGLSPLGMEHLLLGAEGGLAVVTGAGLRLRRLPRYQSSATYRMPGVAEALEAARRLVQWSPPQVLRVLDERESMLLHQREGPLLIVAYWDDEDPAAAEALLAKASRVASSLGGERVGDVYPEWHRRRYEYGRLVEMLASTGLWFDTIDLQATWPSLVKLVGLLPGALEAAGVEAWFYHVSHFYPGGGSLYLTLLAPQDTRALARAWRSVMEAAAEAGALPTHHHGLGLQKLPWARALPGPGSLHAYCLVKSALDPDWVLSPHGAGSLCRRRWTR